MFSDTRYKSSTIFRPCFFKNVSACGSQKIDYACNNHLGSLFGVNAINITNLDGNNAHKTGVYLVKTTTSILKIPWFMNNASEISTNSMKNFVTEKGGSKTEELFAALRTAYADTCNAEGYDSINNCNFAVQTKKGQFKSIYGKSAPFFIRLLLHHLKISNVVTSAPDEKGEYIAISSIPTLTIEHNPETNEFDLVQMNPELLTRYDASAFKTNHVLHIEPLIIAGTSTNSSTAALSIKLDGCSNRI